jgi:hypothetical protein
MTWRCSASALKGGHVLAVMPMLGVARKDERFSEVLGQKRTSDVKHQQLRSLDIAFDQPGPAFEVGFPKRIVERVALG